MKKFFHAKNSISNFVEPNQILIIITLFRWIWNSIGKEYCNYNSNIVLFNKIWNQVMCVYEHKKNDSSFLSIERIIIASIKYYLYFIIQNISPFYSTETRTQRHEIYDSMYRLYTNMILTIFASAELSQLFCLKCLLNT